MRKSIWLEMMEWFVLALVVVFVVGVVALRQEVTSNAESALAPRYSVSE